MDTSGVEHREEKKKTFKMGGTLKGGKRREYRKMISRGEMRENYSGKYSSMWVPKAQEKISEV